MTTYYATDPEFSFAKGLTSLSPANGICTKSGLSETIESLRQDYCFPIERFYVDSANHSVIIYFSKNASDCQKDWALECVEYNLPIGIQLKSLIEGEKL